MYNKGFFILFLLSSWLTQAQLKDSLQLTTKSYHNDYLQRLEEQPLLYAEDLLTNITQTTLSLETKKRNLKRVQTPEKSTLYNFDTKGVFSLSERLRVFGRFNFNKIEEKQMGYNSSLGRTENQAVLKPNYLYAPKKGNWDNQIFDLMGGVSYLLNRNWSAGAIIKYKNHKAYRTLDPRPDIQLADYKLQMHLAYTLKEHKLFANAGLGSASTTAGIIYVDDSQNAPAYQETFTKYASGYGRVVFNSSYPRYLERERPKTAGIGYSYKNDRSRISLNYSYTKAIKNTYNQDANRKVYFDQKLITYKYRDVKHQTKLSYDYDGKKLDYFLELSYDKQTGDNYSVIDQGQNYQQNKEALTLNTAWLRQEKDRMLWQAELDITYQDSDYTDLLGYTKKEVSALTFKVELGRDIWANTKNKINLSVFAETYLPVEEKLELAKVTSDTSFTDNVIKPDHAYDSTTKMTSGAQLNYTLSLPNKKSLRFFATYKNLAALNHAYQSFAPELNVSSSHFATFGIRLFY